MPVSAYMTEKKNVSNIIVKYDADDDDLNERVVLIAFIRAFN